MGSSTGSASLDDGWALEPEATPEDPLTKLVREALTLLEGSAPADISLSGEGWSLVDPKSVAEKKPAPYLAALPAPIESKNTRSFSAMMHDALDEALTDGWALAGDDISEEEAAFFAAGESMAKSLSTVACEVGKYEEEPSFWRRLLRKSA